MPHSRRHRHDDVSDHEHGRVKDGDGDKVLRGRGRDQRRPRVQHRSSTYDDRYGRSRRRSRHYDGYDSESASGYDHGSPPPQRRRRHTRSEGRRRPRGSRSLGRGYEDEDEDEEEELSRQKRDQAVKSALTAGAVEAFRQRNRPGDWMGARGLRVATAALSAAAIDTVVDRDPTRKGKRNIVKSTIGGLVVDKLANGIRGRR